MIRQLKAAGQIPGDVLRPGQVRDLRGDGRAPEPAGRGVAWGCSNSWVPGCAGGAAVVNTCGQQRSRKGLDPRI